MSNDGRSKRVEPEPTWKDEWHQDTFEELLPKGAEIREVVSVMLMRHKILTVTGKATGRKYKFFGAGSIVDDVDKEDAELMVNIRSPKSCCGSTSTPQFQILGR